MTSSTRAPSPAILSSSVTCSGYSGRFSAGGGLRRYVASVREVNGVDERVLSSEIFADDGSGTAQPAAPISCISELMEAGFDPAGSYARRPS